MIAAGFGTLWFILTILLVAAVLWLWPGLASAILGTDPPDRNASLDGLRGVLAVAVILHHGIIAHAHFGGVSWRAPPANFDNLAGQGAVALFFMTSAYLFWGRVVRQGTLEWTAFYRGRMRRLVPMYLAAVALLLAVVAVETDFELRVPLQELLREVVRWGSFSLMDGTNVNGLPETGTILSVTWTLRFEWLFYLTLPFFAYAFRALGRPWVLYTVVAAVAAGFDSLHIVLYFIGGAIAVHAVARWRESAWMRRVVSGAALLALAVLFVRFHDAYALLPALLLFPVFVAALQASGPWAILLWRPLRFLGHISYSVYLLHNPIIHIVGRFGFGASVYAALEPVPLYGALLGIASLTIAIATLTYLSIERPFLAGSSWLRSVPAGARSAVDAASPGRA